jgi:chaperonin GroEL
LLAYSIANQALEATSKPSVNVTQVKRGIEEAIKDVVSELRVTSVDITDEKQIKQIATLSANGDKEIGELVATAIDKVGRDGIVTVEESRSGETTLEVVEGLQFDRGYKSPYMVTDNNSMQAILNDAFILLYDGRLSAIKDLLPVLERVSSDNKALLIVAEDIDGEALSTLIVNKMRGILNVAAVKAPDFGDRRTLILEDIATLTGGTVISPTKGMKLERFNMEWLGKARTITVGKETTTIVDGKGDETKINERIVELKSQIEAATSPYEVERLQDRLAKIVGGVAIINVGGGTEVEMKERKDRIDDALQATKAALEEGILPGAGMALYNARNVIKDRDNSDFGLGGQIVFKACSQPLQKILTNAGEDYYEWIQALKEKNAVPVITEDRTADAFKSGIIDPTKVVRCALENAAAAAVTLLMTECVIHDKPNEKKKDEVDLSQFGM